MPTEPATLDRIRTVAYLLDESVGIPFTKYRVGLDALLGLLPVAGDLVTGALSLYILFEAARLGVGGRTLGRMALNLALDVVVGSVPVVGDLFDAAWKSNVRNANLVARDLGVEST